MARRLASYQSVVRFILAQSACLSLFFVAWWLRPEWMPQTPYIAGFLLTIPLTMAIAAWVLTGVAGVREGWRDGRRWWALIALLLAAWAGWSPAWAGQAGAAESASTQLAFVLLVGVMFSLAPLSPRLLATALAFGLLVQGTIAIVQVEWQRPAGLALLGEFEIRPNNRGLSLLFAGEARLMRPYGLTVHPNVIGGYFAVALLASTGWLVNRRRRWAQIAALVLVAFGLWALLVTFSRSAILGFGVGLLLIGASWLRRGAPRPSRTVVITALSVMLLVSTAFVARYAEFVLARAGVGSEVTELRSVVDRRVYTEIALTIISDFPVTGIGMGNFPGKARDLLRNSPYKALGADHVHNLPLLIASEIGLTGAVLWLALIGIGCWRVWRTAVDPFAVGLGAGAAALLVVSLFDHYPWTLMHFGVLLYACLGAAIRPVPMIAPQSSLGDDRQAHGEGRPFAYIAVDGDVAAVSLDDAVADGKP
jgi:O-antigen ligase